MVFGSLTTNRINRNRSGRDMLRHGITNHVRPSSRRIQMHPSPPRLPDGYVVYVVACVHLATDGQMVLLHCLLIDLLLDLLSGRR
jgi:hypothetical protein